METLLPKFSSAVIWSVAMVVGCVVICRAAFLCPDYILRLEMLTLALVALAVSGVVLWRIRHAFNVGHRQLIAGDIAAKTTLNRMVRDYSLGVLIFILFALAALMLVRQ